MHAKINEAGVLEVVAESGLESYALRKWHDAWVNGAGEAILTLGFRDKNSVFRTCEVRPHEDTETNWG